jgi:regulator of RNase E activity RraA
MYYPAVREQLNEDLAHDRAKLAALKDEVRRLQAAIHDAEHFFIPGDRVVGDDDRVCIVQDVFDDLNRMTVKYADGSERRVNRFAFELATKADG